MICTSLHNTSLKVSSLGRFGAEVSGIKLKGAFDEDVIYHLQTLLAKFQILVFRKQLISPADQTRITRYFGNPEPGISKRPAAHKVAGCSNILYLSNRPGSATQDYGSAWHSDGLAYAKVPHGITMLYCVACPLGVGDTLFASQYDAYEAMPESFRKKLDGLFWYLPNIAYSEIPKGKGLAQPMVRTHSETGRKFLFCSPSAYQICGMTRSESAEILTIVHKYQVRDEFIYSHSWSKNDVVIWENCALLHNRADIVDFAAQGLRAMYRSATSGNFKAIETEPASQ